MADHAKGAAPRARRPAAGAFRARREGAYFADPGEYDLLSDLPLPVRTALQEKHLAEAEGILADCERLGLRILTLGDADYPDRLKNIYDPPAVLYVEGPAARLR